MTEPGGTYLHTETMGRSFCEAMATGLPCISSFIGGIPEIVRSNVDGILVDATAYRAQMDALARLIDTPALRTRMGTCARQKATESYSWETVGSQYRALLLV